MQLKLNFFGMPSELIEVCVVPGTDTSKLIVSVRGKINNDHESGASFQWTKAVRGMACLFVRAKYCREFGSEERPEILGDKLSDGASLDYAISKLPRWIEEMFGVDLSGKAIASRVFKRHNSGRRFPGPVKVMLNHNVLDPNDIIIYLDGREVNCLWQYERLLGSLSGVLNLGREGGEAAQYQGSHG